MQVVFVPNTVYGCDHVWADDGLDSAEAACADGYHICGSKIEATALGLTSSACATTPAQGSLYITRAGSPYLGSSSTGSGGSSNTRNSHTTSGGGTNVSASANATATATACPACSCSSTEDGANRTVLAALLYGCGFERGATTTASALPCGGPFNTALPRGWVGVGSGWSFVDAATASDFGPGNTTVANHSRAPPHSQSLCRAMDGASTGGRDARVRHQEGHGGVMCCKHQRAAATAKGLGHAAAAHSGTGSDMGPPLPSEAGQRIDFCNVGVGKEQLDGDNDDVEEIRGWLMFLSWFAGFGACCCCCCCIFSTQYSSQQVRIRLQWMAVVAFLVCIGIWSRGVAPAAREPDEKQAASNYAYLGDLMGAVFGTIACYLLHGLYHGKFCRPLHNDDLERAAETGARVPFWARMRRSNAEIATELNEQAGHERDHRLDDDAYVTCDVTCATRWSPRVILLLPKYRS